MCLCVCNKFSTIFQIHCLLGAIMHWCTHMRIFCVRKCVSDKCWCVSARPQSHSDNISTLTHISHPASSKQPVCSSGSAVKVSHTQFAVVEYKSNTIRLRKTGGSVLARRRAAPQLADALLRLWLPKNRKPAG